MQTQKGNKVQIEEGYKVQKGKGYKISKKEKGHKIANRLCKKNQKTTKKFGRNPKCDRD